MANAAAAPSPTPAAGFSAERAATERSRLYQAGLAYSRWVDGLAQQSGSEFLQRRVVDRVTWMSVLACLGSLLVLALLNGWLLWFVRRRAGAIESSEHQSWLAFAASSARKPLALIIWVIGGFLAFMPVDAGISSRSERLFPITYFIEKPFQNWSRISEQLLGTIFLYLDYEVPLGELREELKRLVEKNENWDREVCKLQVTETKSNTIEVRALVSSANAGRGFDLRCQVRAGLIEFLRSRYPESLPRVRTVLTRLDESPANERPHTELVEGQEHERGPLAPGLKAAKL